MLHPPIRLSPCEFTKENPAPYSLCIKLTESLLEQLLTAGRKSNISLKFGDKQNILTVDGEEHTASTIFERKALDLYQEETNVWTKIGGVHRRINVSKQTSSRTKGTSGAAKIERDKKAAVAIGLADVTGKDTKKKGRASGSALTNQMHAAPNSKDAQKELRQRLLQDLAEAGNQGRSKSYLQTNFDTKKYNHVLLELAAYTARGLGVYNLKPHLYCEARLDWPGYTDTTRKEIRLQQRRHQETAADARAKEVKLKEAERKAKIQRNEDAPLPSIGAAISVNVGLPPQKKRRISDDLGGKATPQAVSLVKSTACPSTPTLVTSTHEKFVPLPTIETYDEYEEYTRLFWEKIKQYQSLDDLLTCNKKEFEDLGKMLREEQAKSKGQSAVKVIQRKIKNLYAERNEKVPAWRSDYTLLHQELKNIKSLIGDYVNRWKQRESKNSERTAQSS